MNGTSLLNSLWLKGECFTWKRTTKGGRFNHSWPLRKWYFYAFAFLTVQLFIRPFCRDCLRIKEDFKDFGHISFTWMQKLLFLSWVPGNCWDVYDIKPVLFLSLLDVVCCSAGKGLGLLDWMVDTALSFSASDSTVLLSLFIIAF